MTDRPCQEEVPVELAGELLDRIAGGAGARIDDNG